MAKTARQLIAFMCSVCKNRNYISSKNTLETKNKLTLNKFCKHCQKTTEHQEVTKLG